MEDMKKAFDIRSLKPVSENVIDQLYKQRNDEYRCSICLQYLNYGIINQKLVYKPCNCSLIPIYTNATE